MMTKALEGKVALVTGGARGIGAAIARKLAEEGASVGISFAGSAKHAADVIAAIRQGGADGEAYQADQGKFDQARSLVDQVYDRFGALDILVINAGTFATGKVDEEKPSREEVDRLFAVNVLGAAETVRAAARYLNDHGRIISIGSNGATRIPFQGVGDYVASKAALASYTRAWARDLGPRNITVNILQPGSIATDMNPEDSPSSDEQRALCALGRYGQPHEIAAVVAFLAGPGGSFISGATIDVDGGVNA
jgi:3-oxoacyl-[acyl-carrier protein] reductase